MTGGSVTVRAAATSAAPTDPADPAVLADRLRLALVRLGRQLRRQDPPGLTVTLYSALATLADHGELAIGELAGAEGLPPSAATRIADRLAEAGYVVRRPNPADRRGVNLTITENGRRLVWERRKRGDAWLTTRLTRLTDAEREALATALGALEEAMAGDGDS